MSDTNAAREALDNLRQCIGYVKDPYVAGALSNVEDALRALTPTPTPEPAVQGSEQLPGNSDASAEDALARVLEVHQIEWVDDEVGYVCGCDEYGNLDWVFTLADALRHQTRAVAAALPGLGWQQVGDGQRLLTARESHVRAALDDQQPPAPDGTPAWAALRAVTP